MQRLSPVTPCPNWRKYNPNISLLVVDKLDRKKLLIVWSSLSKTIDHEYCGWKMEYSKVIASHRPKKEWTLVQTSQDGGIGKIESIQRVRFTGTIVRRKESRTYDLVLQYCLCGAGHTIPWWKHRSRTISASRPTPVSFPWIRKRSTSVSIRTTMRIRTCAIVSHIGWKFSIPESRSLRPSQSLGLSLNDLVEPRVYCTQSKDIDRWYS